jgi:class 3 adenylate cyclase
VVTVGVNHVNDLLGPSVLFAFAAGRYHNPRIEERALLFIDMRGSTAIAERLGELRYLSLLNRFVGDVSFAVAEASVRDQTRGAPQYVTTGQSGTLPVSLDDIIGLCNERRRNRQAERFRRL